MNVFGKREKQGWRKARKRGVSPIIATILLVAITVVLAAVLYVLISSLTTGGASTVPIGTTFAYGTAQQSGTACGSTYTTAGDCYVIGIQSAGSSATTGNIHFAVQKAGTGVAFLSVALVDAAGATIATYTSSTGAWTLPSSPVAGYTTLPITMASTMSLSVSADTATSVISGDSLVAQGVGSLSGTASIALP